MARAATLRREDRATARWLSATSERICSGRLSPGRTGTDQEADLSQRGAQDAAAQGGASFEAAGSLAEVSQGTAAPEAAAVGAQAGMSRQPPMLPRMAPGSARSVVTASTIHIMTSKEPQAKRHAQRDLPSVHVSSGMPLHVHMLQRV